MLRMTAVLLIAFPLMAVGADPGPKTTPAADLKALEGTWEVVSHEMNGEKAPDTSRIKKRVIKAGKIDLYERGEPDHPIKVDPTKTPKAIDVIAILHIACGFAAMAEQPQKEVKVNFRDIHRDGDVKVIGHFGVPVGKTIKLEGQRAKASKTSNHQTLHAHTVNGRKISDDHRYPPFIQIANIDSLPEDQLIVLEGYQSIRWVGDPETNWHLKVPFVVTKIISPRGLKLRSKLP